MTLPAMLPTGAMSSGEYVIYMTGYCDAACDSLLTEFKSYWGNYTIDKWNEKWTRVTSDLGEEILNIQSEISKMNSKIRMIDDAVKKL